MDCSEDNDFCFVDSNKRICGWAVGMTIEEQQAYAAKYQLHIERYASFKKFWRNVCKENGISCICTRWDVECYECDMRERCFDAYNASAKGSR